MSEKTYRRFDKFVIPEPNSGCWLWSGGIGVGGYGRFSEGRLGCYAHRVSYKRKFGLIPDGLCVLHKCDVPSCVNPDHLFLGTDADNGADKKAKGRSAKGLGHGRVKLTEDQIREIRTSSKSQEKIAKLFGMAQSHVSRIRRGESWRHLP